jgi:hypothetical protein
MRTPSAINLLKTLALVEWKMMTFIGLHRQCTRQQFDVKHVLTILISLSLDKSNINHCEREGR